MSQVMLYLMQCYQAMVKKHFFIRIGLLASCIVLTTTLTQALNTPAPFTNLRGRYIATISDGDFFASTYGDGRIPGKDSRYQDVLTLMPIPFDERAIFSVNISNSVTSAPEALALSPDDQTAFVVEHLGQRSTTATTRQDLPRGRFLTMVDLTNPRQAKVLGRVQVEPGLAIDVHPSGQWVAIATDSSQSEGLLQLVPIQGSKLGTPVTISLAALNIPTAQGSLNASYVEWHPSGQYLAVNLYRQNRIVFLEFKPDATTGKVNLRPWGNPVPVGSDPFTGRFTPNGKYYLTSNWGRDFAATTIEGRLPAKPGTVSVIRLDSQSGNHQVIATAESDRSPEGIAISPDGSLVATVNMRETAFPRNSPRFTREATVSLFRFDTKSEQLIKAGDFPFTGVLPQGIAFDATGENLLVTTFEYLDSKQPTGGLEVWRVEREPNLRLQYTGRIAIPHGAHQVVVAP
jgi:sugar lactone lactonase YvrE